MAPDHEDQGNHSGKEQHDQQRGFSNGRPGGGTQSFEIVFFQHIHFIRLDFLDGLYRVCDGCEPIAQNSPAKWH